MDIKFLKTKLKTLLWCNEDWTPLFFIEAFVREFYRYKDLEVIKIFSLKIIKNLLEEKLVKAGDLLEDDTFIAWDKYIDEILFEIKQKWDSLDRELYPHEIVWLELTEKGEKELQYLMSLPELENKDPFYFDDNEIIK